jgi:hypothetical protein
MKKACLIAFGLAVISSHNVSQAADYSVDFAANTTRLGRDGGTSDCSFERICSGQMEALRLRVTVDVFRSAPNRAIIRLYGNDLSCCFFSNGKENVEIDIREPLSQISFYEGRRVMRELDQPSNTYGGVLYLRFRRDQMGLRRYGKLKLWRGNDP